MKKIGRIIFLAIPAIALLLTFTCCISPRYNLPLAPTIPTTTLAPPTYSVQDSQTLLFITFSGGGTRAMAMGYYVCQELEKIKYSTHTNLMQEIDYASGVSGGSFVAAALPIYKDNWKEFETTAVRKNIQGNIIKRLLLPWNWVCLLSPNYTRTNIAANYYNDYIFKNKTFGDLCTRPQLYLNATLLAEGTHFVYTDKYFRYIGSDINSYPVGYACAASSAFPVGFPAMTLKNYGKAVSVDSLLKDPDYVHARRNKDGDIDLYTYFRLRNFLNNKENLWLHNQDGGMAGNTGIERVLEEWKTNGVINKALNDAKHPLRRMIVIVVDAGTDKDDLSCKKERPPTSLKVILYATTTAMDVLSRERINAVSGKIEDLWQIAQQAKWNNKALSQLEKPYLIEINARNIADKSMFDSFNKLPTSFCLNTKQIEIVKRAVVYLMANSKEYARLLESIKKKP